MNTLSIVVTILLLKVILELTVAKISFQSKYISKDVLDMKFSPDVDKNPSSLHMQGTQTIDLV